MIIKNIEDKIRLATAVSLGSLLAAVAISIVTSVCAYRQVLQSRKNIYILDGNIPVVASQSDMMVNRPAEYRADVELFHSLFFTLTPDNKFIEQQMKKAVYLVDESGAAQYNDLKENGYFNSILSSSSVLTLQTDSITLDLSRKYFRYYGKLRIERRSATLVRSLITEGYLRDMPRSENNPHGVLITGWKTLENKDLEHVQKNNL
jgi:conjugative transposon TraK protein